MFFSVECDRYFLGWHYLLKWVRTICLLLEVSQVSDVGNVVLRDRQMLAKDGMFTIVAVIDRKTRKVVGEPQVTSRGFIYVKENFDLVNATKKRLKNIVAKSTSEGAEPNWDYIKNSIRDDLGQFLFQKTQKRPMVLPVVIEV